MSEAKEKIVIKRYRNRKLYDTNHSVYVTLDDIAEMVREHQDIQVLENDTGEDITSSTLAQILYEREKKSRGFLTLGELNRIIRERGQAVRDFVERAMPGDRLLDEGAISSFYEEVEKQVGRLFKKGPHEPEERERMMRRLFAAPQQSLEEFLERIENRMQETFNHFNLVSGMRDQMHDMQRQIRHMERELQAIKQTGGTAAQKSPAEEDTTEDAA